MKQILTSKNMESLTRITFTFFFTMLSYACSGESPATVAEEINLRQTCEPESVYVGEWEDSDLNDLTIRPDCTGTEQVCAMSFDYFKPVNGQVLIHVKSSFNHQGCLQPGDHTCSISWSEDDAREYLFLNCGGGQTIYLPRINI